MYLLLSALICAFLSSSAHAASTDPEVLKLQKRLRALEKKVDSSLAESDESDRTVKSYLNTQIKIGGFFESALSSVSQSGQSMEVAASSNTLGINLGAEFSDNIRFASQFLTSIGIPIENEHSDPRAAAAGLPPNAQFRDYTFGTLITQGYVEWGASEAFNIQGGMGYVPFGITFQQLELVLFVRRGGSQLLHDTSLVFPLWEGIHIHGLFNVSDSRWGYDTYTFSPQTNARTLGGGGRVWWHSTEENLNLGVSTQVGKRGNDTYDSLGGDVKFHYQKLTVTSEYVKSFGTGDQPWSFYLEPDYDLYHQSILVYVFADYLSNPLNQTGAGTVLVSDPISKWQYGTGVNWLPTSFTRLRAGVTFNNYVGNNNLASGQNRNYWGLDVSAGVAF